MNSTMLLIIKSLVELRYLKNCYKRSYSALVIGNSESVVSSASCYIAMQYVLSQNIVVFPFEVPPLNLPCQNYACSNIRKPVKIINSGNYQDHTTQFYAKIKISDLFKHEVAEIVFQHCHQNLVPLLSNFLTKCNRISLKSTRVPNL